MFLIDPQSCFKFAYKPVVTANANDIFFVYQDNKIGLTRNNQLPTCQNMSSQQYYCFGHIDDRQCLLAENTLKLTFSETKTSHQWLPAAHYQAAAIGRQWYHWRRAHQFCGQCAAPMIDRLTERSRECPNCQHVVYPKISPCVIILITKGKEILLARSPHFIPGMMSALAGFIEVGESVEQAIVREVQEEVGITIHNIKYISSQPWPFSDALMLGFTAEYVSGEVMLQANEIEAAGWYHPDNLPQLPHPISIARYLIDMTLKNIAAKNG